MEIIQDLIKILVPASLVLAGIYFTMRQIITRQFEKELVEIREKTQSAVLPIRLQAYERMALYLERISPSNILVRVMAPNMLAMELQQRLTSDIQEELNHNLSQQIYLSEPLWNAIKATKNDLIGIVNAASEQIAPSAPAMELANAILEILMQRNLDPCEPALHLLRKEVAVYIQ